MLLNLRLVFPSSDLIFIFLPTFSKLANLSFSNKVNNSVIDNNCSLLPNLGTSVKWYFPK